MFASPAAATAHPHHPHHHQPARLASAQQQQQQPPPPPPTLREILDAFGKDGNGDREMLMTILASKRAEEERIASQLNYQTQLFVLAQQYQALQAHALVAAQQQQQQQAAIAGRSFSEATPSPASTAQPLPSPSLSHLSESPASSSRYSPYARVSGGSHDALHAPAFRSEKIAKVHSAAKARVRARGSSSASSTSSVSSAAGLQAVAAAAPAPAPSVARQSSPAKSVTRDSSMSPPPVPVSVAATASSGVKRASLSDLLAAGSSAYAQRESLLQESFLRGSEDEASSAAKSE